MSILIPEEMLARIVNDYNNNGKAKLREAVDYLRKLSLVGGLVLCHILGAISDLQDSEEAMDDLVSVAKVENCSRCNQPKLVNKSCRICIDSDRWDEMHNLHDDYKENNNIESKCECGKLKLSYTKKCSECEWQETHGAEWDKYISDYYNQEGDFSVGTIEVEI